MIQRMRFPSVIAFVYAVALCGTTGCQFSTNRSAPEIEERADLGAIFDCNDYGNSIVAIIGQADAPVILEDVIVNGVFSLRTDAGLALPDTLEIGEIFRWIDTSFFDQDQETYGRRAVYVDLVTSRGSSRRWNLID